MTKKEKFDINSLIENSGHDFHDKVISLFSEHDWQTLPSQYYVDIITKKRREIDIIASKEFTASDIFQESSKKLKINLYIDVKHIPNHNVFWFEEKDIEKAEKLAMDNFILRRERNICLKNTSVIPNIIHHYIQDNKASRKWSFEKKKGYKDDIFFSAQEQVLHSLLHYSKNSSYNEIHYPVIIINSFDKIFIRDNGEAIPAKNNFQIQIDYSHGADKIKKSDYFLIDIIAFEFLSNFIEQIESNDIKILLDHLRFNLRTNKPKQYKPRSFR